VGIAWQIPDFARKFAESLDDAGQNKPILQGLGVTMVLIGET
jgi:hypothetical protein